MGTGFLEVVTQTAFGGMPVPNAKVTVLGGDSVLYQMTTDISGLSEIVALEAPEKELTLDPGYTGIPYSICDVQIEAEGYATTIIHGVEILDTETSILPIEMEPATDDGEIHDIDIPNHQLVDGEQRSMDVAPALDPSLPHVLPEVIIPEFITVHLGRPDRAARNVRVPFVYYIKNCASHEIFSTWPPASLEANIYCIISLTLNRIFTEWYRVRGHNFDITNSTQFDQMFVEGGQIFQNIDRMVDQIFNRFIRREGHLEPFFAEYCDGRQSTCPGLWQWGTVTLAQQGMNAMQILRHYYPNDIQIVETNNIGGVAESFPGFVLRPGMSGSAVRTLQTWLNRIRVNFPAIPAINPIDGVYGAQTEAAVRAFQSIRSLGSVTPNGIVDRATWNNISRTYSAVKSLGELTSEGIIMGIGRTPPTTTIRQGSTGRLVQQAQYMLNFISEFYHDIPEVLQNSSFTAAMTAAVQAFQRRFGLNPDGVIGSLTWAKLYEVYWLIRDDIEIPGGGGSVPPIEPPPAGIPPYPGFVIRPGSRGSEVERIQRCLNAAISTFPSIPSVNVDGAYGPLTQASVAAFQRSFGLNPDGLFGPLTWGALMNQCYGGSGGGGSAPPSYPGFLIRRGANGNYVAQIQTCLNRVNNAQLNADGAFGPLTETAVINFQRRNGLTPDGIVGPRTWETLMNQCHSGKDGSTPLPYPGFLIRRGANGNYVVQIQSCLNQVNNARLTTDGVFGPLTEAAVINYQRANALTPDGIVGPLTWNHLMSRCGTVHTAATDNFNMRLADTTGEIGDYIGDYDGTDEAISVSAHHEADTIADEVITVMSHQSHHNPPRPAPTRATISPNITPPVRQRPVLPQHPPVIPTPYYSDINEYETHGCGCRTYGSPPPYSQIYGTIPPEYPPSALPPQLPYDASLGQPAAQLPPLTAQLPQLSELNELIRMALLTELLKQK